MLSSQYLASCLQHDHPCHKVVSRPPGPRNKKATLKSAFSGDVNHHLVDGYVPVGHISSIQNKIHTEAVSDCLAKNTPNPLLGVPPPPVDKSELNLLRVYRSPLSQLCSSCCIKLLDYQCKIGICPNSVCPECNNADQTVSHLFECDAHHTTLTVIDLWLNPCRVARFISSLLAFSHLPRLQPP